MSFMSVKRKIETMLKKIAEAFRDNENMMFRPNFEEVVATSLTSKNKLRELVGNIKKQGISSENKDSRK